MKAVLAKLEGRLVRGSRCLALHAANNGCTTLGLTPKMARSLVEVHLPHNRIKIVAGLEALTNLQVLDLSHNQLARRRDLRALSLNARLRVLSIHGNPLAKSLTAQELRSTVLHLLPALRSLDGKAFCSPSSSLAPFKKANDWPAAAARFEVNSYLALHERASNRSTNQIATHSAASCCRSSISNSNGVTYAQQRHLQPRTTTFAPGAAAAAAAPSRSRLRYIPPWRRVPDPLPKGWGQFNVSFSVAGYVSASARIENALNSAAGQCTSVASRSPARRHSATPRPPRRGKDECVSECCIGSCLLWDQNTAFFVAA